MDAHSEHGCGIDNTRTRKRRPILTIVVLVVCAIILVAIIVPHTIRSKIAGEEANAVHSLRILWQHESRYATAHPSKGFTCDFAELKTVASSNGQFQDGFLFSQSFEGYKYNLAGCEADSRGVAIRYKATAVPQPLGEFGLRAFCMDQTGRVLYSDDGTTENCKPWLP